MRARETALLTIQDVAFGGDGVSRNEGKVWFVPYTANGEVVEAVAEESRSGFVRARLKKVVTPSPDRIEPPCRFFGKCGGCAYQHLSYEAQLLLKTEQVRQTLKRIAHLGEVPVRPMVPSPKPFEFRNRITVHCEQGRVGFFEKRGNRLVDIDRCLLADPEVNLRLTELRQRPPREGNRTLRADSKRAPFEQTNSEVAAELLKTVQRSASQTGGRHRAVDAYCGSGFFSRPLAALGFESVIGLDWSHPAIDLALQQEAFPGLEYRCGDVAELLEAALRGADLLLLDPPREGLTKQAMAAVLKFPPPMVLYVSCDPATFARDAKAMAEAGLKLREVQPFDMFPQTSEIELLGIFERTARNSREIELGENEN